MGTCKDCIFYSFRGNNNLVGECSKVNSDIQYWDDNEVANEKIKDGELGGENVYVSLNFGCIHFKES